MELKDISSGFSLGGNGFSKFLHLCERGGCKHEGVTIFLLGVFSLVPKSLDMEAGRRILSILHRVLPPLIGLKVGILSPGGDVRLNVSNVMAIL